MANEFFRLHLINNTVLEICIAGEEHNESNMFLQDLFIKFNIIVQERNVYDLSFEEFRIKLQSHTNKFR
jgi:hypothetical protein